jgi:chromosome segregation ATPase
MGIAMEGNKVEAKIEGDNQPLEVEVPGGYFIHGRLTSQIGQLEQSIRDLAAAKKNAEDTIVTVRREEAALNEDLPRWGKDVAGVTDVRERLEQRLDKAVERLKEAWEAVVQMGRQYDGEMALLQADAEKRVASRP